MKSAHDLVAEAKAHIREIDTNAAEQAIRDADLLLDVREADEFQAGHIPGAVNIPRGVLEFKLGNDPQLAERGLDIVIYCKTGGRAALAARALKEMGYLQVQSIAGGFDAWAAADKPVARPSQPIFE
ncbi:MAG TPA: rhodanese-like domain-containing protein [Pseudomonas sp.]|nr:rhodanese-like domain-containing protein [Pseudomonas sp.]